MVVSFWCPVKTISNERKKKQKNLHRKCNFFAWIYYPTNFAIQKSTSALNLSPLPFFRLENRVIKFHEEIKQFKALQWSLIGSSKSCHISCTRNYKRPLHVRCYSVWRAHYIYIYIPPSSCRHKFRNVIPSQASSVTLQLYCLQLAGCFPFASLGSAITDSTNSRQ